MATIKVKFRRSTVAAQEGTLFFQVIHRRSVRQINVRYRLFPEEWDETNERLRGCTNSNNRMEYIVNLKEKLESDIHRLQKSIDKLDRAGIPYTADDVVAGYYSGQSDCMLFNFMTDIIVQLKKVNKLRTSETYQSALNSFRKFREGKDVAFDEIDANMISAYEAYLKQCDICPNTSSFYMRNLRAVYNRAVDKNLTPQQHPFKYVYTGVEKTVKRATPLKTVKMLKELEVPAASSLAWARDMFLFSFYTRGMAFVDMSYLKKSNLKNGILIYRRKKTQQKLFIRWEKCMQEIIERYDTADSPYLLPIIRSTEKDTRLQYLSASHLVNRKLKILGARLGLPVPLTMYVARHTWASVAQSKRIPLSVISEGMGHESENTTRIYLASLDTNIVDKANRAILNLL